MKNVILLLMLVIISVTPLVISIDEQMITSCGGDNQLTIGCFGDSELSFILPSIATPTHGSISGGAGGTVIVNSSYPYNASIEPTEESPNPNPTTEFLDWLGAIIYPSNPRVGVMVLIGAAFSFIFIIGYYKPFKKIKTRLKEKENRKKISEGKVITQ